MNAPDWEDVSVFIREFATDVTVFNPDGADLILKGIFDDAFFLSEIGEADMEITEPRLTMTEKDAAHLNKGMAVQVNNIDYHVYQVKPDGTGLVTVKLSKDHQ